MTDVSHEIVEHAHNDHAHSNTVEILGREITVEGGIYTVIFAVLAIVTILEVLSAELLNSMIAGAPEAGFLTVIKAVLLLGMAVFKTVLVVLFYMHLKDDNRILAVAVILPLLIAALSVMFVLSIPPTGYGL